MPSLYVLPHPAVASHSIVMFLLIQSDSLQLTRLHFVSINQLNAGAGSA